MSLREQIGSDMKTAMLGRDSVTRDILRVVKAEIARNEDASKQLDDAGIQAVITKMVKSLKEVDTDEARNEISVLEAYLPTMLSEHELGNIIQHYINELEIEASEAGQPSPNPMKMMGPIMKRLKDEYPGQVDNKMASQMIRNA